MIAPPDSYDVFLAFGPDNRTLTYGSRVWDLGDGTTPEDLDLAGYLADDWTGNTSQD